MHRLFLRTVGGRAALRALIDLLHATADRHFWVLAVHEPAWTYLQRIAARLKLDAFRDHVRLSPMDGEQLAGWLEARTKAQGWSMSYAELAGAGPLGADPGIGLRTVRITTLDDNLISVPNSRFLTEAVSCANAGALDQMCVFDFYIGCHEDFELAKELVYDAAAASMYVYLKKPLRVLVREGPLPSGEHFAIKIVAKAYVFDGRFESAFGTDVTERVQRAFRKHGIQTAGQVEYLWQQQRGALTAPGAT